MTRWDGGHHEYRGDRSSRGARAMTKIQRGVRPIDTKRLESLLRLARERDTRERYANP